MVTLEKPIIEMGGVNTSLPNISTKMDPIYELMEIAKQPMGAGLYQFRSLISALQYKKLHNLVSKYVSRGQKVLDWGAARGHFSFYLAKEGYQTTAFSFEQCSYSGLLPPSLQWVHGDSTENVKIPFLDSTFDAVVSVGVLEHVREFGGDEILSLKEIHRILNPGGFFICYHFPNRWSWIEGLARCIPGKHYHPHRYTTRQIRDMVTLAGLSLVEVNLYAFLPRNIWNKAPKFLSNSKVVAAIWDFFDRVFERILAPICQNYFFVAQK